jgi:hypothetical protein
MNNFVAPGNEPFNSTAVTARPGQIVTLWGTGLGAGLNADNVAPQPGNLPTPIEIFVGGKAVTNIQYSGRTPCCVGVDQIVFAVPPDTPVGCYVPLVVRVNGSVVSNTVTIGVTSDGGSACPESSDPITGRLLAGGRIGNILLIRSSANHREYNAQYAATFDGAVATFSEERGGQWTFHPSYSQPPLGACSALTSRGALGGQASASTIRPLDAGGQLSVTASGETFPVRSDPRVPGRYAATLGGQVLDFALPLLVLNPPGQIQIQGSGGSDVASFGESVDSADAITWTNRAQVADINRAAGQTVTWTNSTLPSDKVWIFGGVADAITDSLVTFSCSADASAGSFHIPSYVLSALPSARTRESQARGFLAISGYAGSRERSVSAQGLDVGAAVYLNILSNTVRYH